jgi:hypothetical protein
MIIYDIALMPVGLRPDIWHQLSHEGILLYDSTLTGNIPFKTEPDNVSLIDISSMTPDSIKILTDYINKENEELDVRQSEGYKIARENNDKLISYLKKINDSNQ